MRATWRVTWRSKTRSWLLAGPRNHREYFRTKAQAVDVGRRMAAGTEPSQLVVHGRDGRIQFEHTYPRWSDPERFVG